MRLINKYETSMGGRATIGARFGAGVEVGVGLRLREWKGGVEVGAFLGWEFGRQACR